MRRGMTLAELMVAMALLGALTWVALNFVTPTARSFSRTTSRAELQQQALVVGNRLAADIARSSVSAINYHNSTDASDALVIGLDLIDGVDAEGRQIWSKQLVAYIWTPSTRHFIRRVWKQGDQPPLLLVLDGENPTWTAEDQLVRLAREGPMTGDELLATQVTTASLSSALPPPDIAQPIRLSLHLERWSAQGSVPETFDLARDMTTRNTAQWPVAKPATPVP